MDVYLQTWLNGIVDGVSVGRTKVPQLGVESFGQITAHDCSIFAHVRKFGRCRIVTSRVVETARHQWTNVFVAELSVNNRATQNGRTHFQRHRLPHQRSEHDNSNQIIYIIFFN